MTGVNGNDHTTAFVGATLLPVSGPPIQSGGLHIRGGKIRAIGRDVGIDGADTVFDCRGLTIAPGLIDCHCHVGIVPEQVDWEYSDVNEDTDPVTSHVQARDGIDFGDLGFQEALEGGVTSLLIHPGSSNVIGGLDLAVKTAGIDMEDRIIREPAGMKAAWTAAGRHGKEGKYPRTRMGIAAILREELIKARDYLEKDEKERSSMDTQDEMRAANMARVLTGEIPIRIHSTTPADFRSMLRIKEEFGIDITIEHGDEGHLMADELAAAGVPVVYGPFVGDRRFRVRPHTRPDAALLMSRAGVTISLQTDHPVIPIRDLRLQGSLLIRFGGAEPDEILPMLTTNGAAIMGMQDRIGSLEMGKDADLGLYSGHPLKVQSRVLTVFIDGRHVYGDLPAEVS